MIAGCRSGAHLAEGVAARCGALSGCDAGDADALLLRDVDDRFENAETCVRLGADVEGADVYVIQSLCDPVSGRSVDDNYVALLAAGRALREYGAAHATAVIPYLAYGRQDKPTEGAREPVTARLMADLTIAAGFDRVMAWHPHCGQLRGFYGGIPVHFLDPLPFFRTVFADCSGREDAIVVAPDSGAAGLAIRVAEGLGLRFAVGAKHRPARDTVVTGDIAGDFAGVETALIVEDELGTGKTVSPLVEKLTGELGLAEVRLAVSHNRCLDSATDRMRDLHDRLGLSKLAVTDSIPQTKAFTDLGFVRVYGLADALSQAILGIHGGPGPDVSGGPVDRR